MNSEEWRRHQRQQLRDELLAVIAGLAAIGAAGLLVFVFYAIISGWLRPFVNGLN